MNQDMNKGTKGPQAEEQAAALPDRLNIAGELFGLTREEMFDLSLDLRSNSSELVRFAENNQDLTPQERLQELKDLVSIVKTSRPVEALNALMEEVGNAAAARKAIYLVEAVRKTRQFSPIEGKVAIVDAEFSDTKAELSRLQEAGSIIERSISKLSGSSPSAQDVELALDGVGDRLSTAMVDKLNGLVADAVRVANATGASVETSALKELKDAVAQAIGEEEGALRKLLEENRTTESRIVGASPGGVEMAVWADFVEYFGIDDRDFDKKFDIMKQIDRVFPGQTWTISLREALQVGRDMRSKNIQDVLRQVQRGFDPSEQFQELSGEGAEHDDVDDQDWNGSDGWT